MIEILNLAVPYFGLIFIGFACGKGKACRKRDRLDELLPALCVVAGVVVRHYVENAVCRAEQATIPDCPLMASLPPALNVFVIARQNDTWIEPASVAVLIGTFASVVTLTSVMWLLQTGRLAFP